MEGTCLRCGVTFIGEWARCGGGGKERTLGFGKVIDVVVPCGRVWVLVVRDVIDLVLLERLARAHLRRHVERTYLERERQSLVIFMVMRRDPPTG